MTVPDTYAAYTSEGGTSQFTGWLQERAEPAWTEMLEHRFTREMATGEISPNAFVRHLVEEHAFVDTFASALGYAIAKAPTMTAKRRLSESALGIATDQQEYFERAFDKYGVSEQDRLDHELSAAAEQFQHLLLRAGAAGEYEEAITPMVATEWLYATWCARAVEAHDPDPGTLIGERVHMHVTDDYQEHAEWLRSQMNDLGPDLPARRQRRIERLFRGAVELEVGFHDAAYSSD